MFPTDTGERPLINQGRTAGSLSRGDRQQTGYTDAARRRSWAPPTGGRRLVIADDVRAGPRGGRPTGIKAAMLLGLGFRAEPVRKTSRHLTPIAPTVRVEPGHGGLTSEMPGVGLARSFGVATIAASFSVGIVGAGA